MIIRKRTNKGGSVSYQLDLGKVGTQRKQISFPTREEAEAFLSARKTERREHGSVSLQLTERDRRRFIAAQDQLKEYGVGIEEVLAFYKLHHQPRQAVTYARLVDACYWDKLRLNKRPKYVEELKRCGNAFGREGHAEKDASRITQRDIEKWLGGKGWSPKSQTVYLINLTTIFAYGLEKGHVTINPCAKIQRPTLDEKPPEIFTVEECRRLLAAALETEDPLLKRGLCLQLLGYVSICLFAGVRPEEAQRLDWSEINLAERFIEVPALKSKTRRRRIVIISENLAAWLSRVENPTGPVTPIGFVKRRRTLQGIADIEKWPSDVLRHSFASYHLAKHQSAEQTALQMGHAGTQMLFAHYRELVRPKEATAFWQLMPESDQSN